MSPTTSLLYYNLSYKISKNWLVEGDIFNLLNTKADDITYYYTYRLTPTSPVESGNTFHAAEPRTFRIALTYRF
jgi:outer membrane receptor protein involved in Fe transport